MRAARIILLVLVTASLGLPGLASSSAHATGPRCKIVSFGQCENRDRIPRPNPDRPGGGESGRESGRQPGGGTGRESGRGPGSSPAGDGGPRLQCNQEYGDATFRCPDAEPGGGGPSGGEQVQISLPDIVREEFQNFDIPPSVIHSSPDGWGVSQRKTGFWADSSAREFDMTLLGVPVRVRATPVEYRWDFGDGQSETTNSAGTRPREGEDPSFAHVYRKAGTYTVRLTTVYRGEFSVDGGGWMPIAGRAAIASEPMQMTIYRYHRYLVDEDCVQNPGGPDC